MSALASRLYSLHKNSQVIFVFLYALELLKQCRNNQFLEDLRKQDFAKQQLLPCYYW